jgi:hypothetical protein
VFNKWFSKAVLLTGLVVARSFRREFAASFAKALSFERILAANQGVLNVLVANSVRCAAAY